MSCIMFHVSVDIGVVGLWVGLQTQRPLLVIPMWLSSPPLCKCSDCNVDVVCVSMCAKSCVQALGYKVLWHPKPTHHTSTMHNSIHLAHNWKVWPSHALSGWEAGWFPSNARDTIHQGLCEWTCINGCYQRTELMQPRKRPLKHPLKWDP